MSPVKKTGGVRRKARATLWKARATLWKARSTLWKYWGLWWKTSGLQLKYRNLQWKSLRSSRQFLWVPKRNFWGLQWELGGLRWDQRLQWKGSPITVFFPGYRKSNLCNITVMTLWSRSSASFHFMKKFEKVNLFGFFNKRSYDWKQIRFKSYTQFTLVSRGPGNYKMWSDFSMLSRIFLNSNCLINPKLFDKLSHYMSSHATFLI